MCLVRPNWPKLGPVRATAASTWWNRHVFTARYVEPRVRCTLNRVESRVAESLVTRFLMRSAVACSYVKLGRVARSCLSCSFR